MSNFTVPKDLFPEAGSFGMVLYTDGGANNDTELSGWGLHGYIYPMVEEKGTKLKKSKDATSNIGYIDGRELDKKGVSLETEGGISLEYDGGYIENTPLIPKLTDNKKVKSVSPTHFIDAFGGQHKSTNNFTELTGMYRGLQIVDATDPEQATFQADSMYVLEGLLKNRDGWTRNEGMTSERKPVKNWVYWQKIYAVYDSIISKGKTKLFFSHVKGHSGEPGNEKADYNANRGMITEQLEPNKEELRITPKKGYIQTTKLSSRLLEQRWWYALTDRPSYQEPFDPRFIYFFGNHGKAEEEDDQIGKSTATAKVSILFAKEKEPVLEHLGDYLKQRHYEGTQFLTLGYLENILQAERYSNLLEEKDAILWDDARRGVIKTPDKVPVIKELHPTYLGFRLISRCESMVEVIRKYLEKKDTIGITDITEKCIQVIQEGNKKPVYKPTAEIDSPNKTVSVKVNYQLSDKTGNSTTLKLKLGQDIPLRNTLNATATEDMKIFVVTWPKGNTGFYYGTIVEVDGDLLFTASLDSNVYELVGKL